MRNSDCSRYQECLTVAALADKKQMGCLSCEYKNDTTCALSSDDPGLYDVALSCCLLLIAMFETEPIPERTPIPKILNWTVTKHEQSGRYRAYKRIGGDVKYLYLGMNLMNAERKIAAFENSRTAQ